MKLIITKNISTLSLDIIVIDENRGTFLAKDGSYLPIIDGNHYEPFIRLPYNTTIETELTEKDYELLLRQKDADKSVHIDNLNDIIIKLLSKD